MIHIRRFTALLLAMALCLQLYGCSQKLSLQNSSSEIAAASSTTISETNSNTDTAVTTAADPLASTTSKAETAVSSASTEKSTVSAASTTKRQSDTAVTTKRKPERTTTKATAATTTKAATTATTTKATTCTLTIECSEILKNIDDLKEGHSAYVPANGYILKNYSYTVESGDTVYDVLKSACNDRGIKLTAQDGYIVGINNLDQKDCGKYSGWKYKVNDVFPILACDKYIVSAGDKIVFTFVLQP